MNVVEFRIVPVADDIDPLDKRLSTPSCSPILSSEEGENPGDNFNRRSHHMLWMTLFAERFDLNRALRCSFCEPVSDE